MGKIEKDNVAKIGIVVDDIEAAAKYYADLFGIEDRERDSLMGRLLEMTRMAPFRTRTAGKLSGGMKQKLALMCTLLHHPQILLLDEPTNGVDPVSRRDFWAILYQLVKEGMTVLVSTSYLDEAERCNRVAMMHQGRVISCDSPEALKLQLGGETCYELRSADPLNFRRWLEDIPGILSVEPAGAALHVFVSTGSAEEFLRMELGIRTPAPFQLMPVAPSLEDVFIRLISRIRQGKA
jgi:ABC-2 type transport system ATP-binding protein